MNNLPVSLNQSGSIPPPTSFYQDSAVWDIIPLPYIILGSSAGWLGTTPQPTACQNYSNYSMQHLSLPTLICPFFPSCGNLNSLWPFAPSISWLTWCFPRWLCMACHAAIVTTWLGPLDYRSIGGPLKWMSCKTFFIGIFYCFILFHLCFFSPYSLRQSSSPGQLQLPCLSIRTCILSRFPCRDKGRALCASIELALLQP